MIRYELYNRTDFFCREEHSLASPNPSNIVLDSIFWGTLSNQTKVVEKSIVLDTNIFNYIRQNPQGEASKRIVEISKTRGVMLDPSFALIEQRLRHGNPDEALKQYVESLKHNFGARLSRSNVESFGRSLIHYFDALRFNVGLLRDYLPLIKKLWNSSNDPINKVKELADEMISHDLPRFTFVFLLAPLHSLLEIQILQ